MTGKNVIDIESVRVKKKPAKKKQPLSPRQQKQRKRKLLISAGIVLLLALTLGYSSYKIVSLQLEKNRLQAEQEKLKSERDKLKDESKNVQNLDYIEQQARKQLHLVLPGEILYVLPETE